MLWKRLTHSTPVKTSVELYYDIVSPYTFLQFELLNRQRDHWKSMELSYKPVLISNIMKASNNKPPMLCAAKGIYLAQDLARLSDYHKIPISFQPEKFFEFALGLKNKNVQLFLTSLYETLTLKEHESLIRAYFGELFKLNGKDISQIDVLREIALGTGLAKDSVDAAIGAIDKKETYEKCKKNSLALVDLGAFGLPTTVLHLSAKPEIVWGSDRIHIIGHMLGEKEPAKVN